MTIYVDGIITGTGYAYRTGHVAFDIDLNIRFQYFTGLNIVFKECAKPFLVKHHRCLKILQPELL